MSVTRPFSTVTSEPQHTEHSQQVLGWTAAPEAAPRSGGRVAATVTSVMATAILPRRRHVAREALSIERGAARPDRWAPFLDLAADEAVEPFGRALVLGHHRVAELLQALTRLRVVERGAERLVEPGDHGGRRRRRRDQRIPARCVEILQALLGSTGEIGQHRRALARERRDRLHG